MGWGLIMYEDVNFITISHKGGGEMDLRFCIQIKSSLCSSKAGCLQMLIFSYYSNQ